MTLVNRHSFLAWLGRLACVGLLIATAGCGSSPTAPSTSSGPFSKNDLVLGTGAEAISGHFITVSYTGWLYNTANTDGKGTQFDTSPSYTFPLGVGQVIPGWDQGVPGMRVGGQRRLIIPPELAYGSNGRGAIPPNATLVFDIGLISVQ